MIEKKGVHKGPPCTKDVQYKGGPSAKDPNGQPQPHKKTQIFTWKVFGGTIEVVCRDSGTVQGPSTVGEKKFFFVTPSDGQRTPMVSPKHTEDTRYSHRKCLGAHLWLFVGFLAPFRDPQLTSAN